MNRQTDRDILNQIETDRERGWGREGEEEREREREREKRERERERERRRETTGDTRERQDKAETSLKSVHVYP